ncbi:MAG: ShlB/FhaC/HecB family hemolysin secretion/activation protein, partial [Rhodoferax sp.]|nr:ShlB/FhaC/HecB family hemolysin secretion/activation protein [Rhodoferax sp.]
PGDWLFMALVPDVFIPPTRPPAIVAQHLAGAAPLALRITSAQGLHIAVLGNTLLSPAAVRSALEQAANPQEALSQLEAAYRRAGYLLVGLRAVTDQANHAVSIQIIEGQLTQIQASPGVTAFYRGTEFDPSLTENALIRRNILAEMYASRSGLGFRPSLAPAPQPGGSTLTVETAPVPQFKPLSGSVVFGNYGSRYVGGDVLGENLTLRPGDGWLLGANYSHGMPNLTQASTGSRSDAGGLFISRVTPWGIYGLNLQRSSYRLGVAGAPYYPQGITQTSALTGSQLVWASPTARLSLNEALTHVAYKSEVLDGAYTLADQNYNYLTLGAQGSRNVQVGGLQGAVNLALGYNLGLSGRRGTLIYDVPSAPQSRFRNWSFNASWQQNLPQGWSLNAAASGQWGINTQPANQQWVLGGYGNLAAWTPGILSGDGGYLLRTVAQTPNWDWKGWQINAQAFAEQGAVTTHYLTPNVPGWRMLADVGLGLTFTAPWKTSLSVQAARPVANKNVAAATLASQRAVYFVLQQPF